MKRTLKCFVAVSILLAAFLSGVRATTNVVLSVDYGTNAVLHWPSQTNQGFMIGYRPTLSVTNSWELLTTAVAATNGSQTTFTNQGVITTGSSGFYVVSEFSEDFNGDGIDNETELLFGNNPFIQNDSGEASYPSSPSVYYGEVVIYYNTNMQTATNFGPFLYADSITVNDMTTTEPTPGELHLNWHSSVVDHYSSSVVHANDGSRPSFTPDEVVALRDAFGQGTSISGGIISAPNQSKIDALPVDLLERYEQVALQQLDKSFANIQAINAGAKVGSVDAWIAQIHTMFTREQSICSSLAKRIGRSASKVFPALGGIFVIANAALNAQDFIDAAQAYARDILYGYDETGDAAIFAGVCNNIAPGSQSYVLGYLLR